MNKKNKGASTNVAFVFMDILMLSIACGIVMLIMPIIIGEIDYVSLLTTYFTFGVIYILSNKEARYYNLTLFFYVDRCFKIITRSWTIATVVLIVILFSVNVSDVDRSEFIFFIVIAYVLLLINMFIQRFLQRFMNEANAPRVAYVGNYEDFQKFIYYLNKTSIKVEQVGYIKTGLEDNTEHKGIANVLGSIRDLEEIIRVNNLDQIIFMQKKDDKLGDFQYYIDLCIEMGVTAKVIITSSFNKRSNSYVSSVGTYPIITYHTITLNNYELAIKRFGDFVLSLFAIIVTSPIMLVTAIAIKLDSPGPVIFKQKRVGQNGRLFNIYKFRSMYQDAEERKKELMAQNEVKDGLMFKMKDDPRITKVGKFIRKTSIDELPQFFNIFMGTMSLVGTRPPTIDEVEKYRRQQWRRISIKPGLTGMWQVSGRSSIKEFDEVVKLDLQYIDNWSLLLDLKILFKTVGVLFKKDNAY